MNAIIHSNEITDDITHISFNFNLYAFNNAYKYRIIK